MPWFLKFQRKILFTLGTKIHDESLRSNAYLLLSSLKRTLNSIFPFKMHDEDAVDQCIALINAQASSPANQRARLHFWKGKYTVHVYS